MSNSRSKTPEKSLFTRMSISMNTILGVAPGPGGVLQDSLSTPECGHTSATELTQAFHPTERLILSVRIKARRSFVGY